jgi:hypothetical protein
MKVAIGAEAFALERSSIRAGMNQKAGHGAGNRRIPDFERFLDTL